MEQRLNPYKVAPDAMKPIIDLEASITASGLEPSLIALVKTRASQMNGCAYCLHLHTREARQAGESEERLYLLDAWAESALYTDRERAALAWTEALTDISASRAPDATYDALAERFTDEETVKLTLAITTINAWNRIAIGFRYVHPVPAAKHGG